jgi:excisionase family DNA binding protein
MVRLMKVPEVAEYLGVCPATVWSLISEDRIPSVKVGRARRIPEDSLIAYVDGLRTATN